MKKILLLGILSALLIMVVGCNKEELTVTYTDALWAADFKDNRVLMGAADNVFVAKVMKEVKTIDNQGNVETQFEVEVTDNIKGKFPQKTIVSQYGGITEINNQKTMVLFEGDSLLEVGKTYLLASRSGDGETNLPPLIISPAGKIEVTTENKGELVKKFTKAYNEEIVLDEFKKK
jgi:hypothetical protein